MTINYFNRWSFEGPGLDPMERGIILTTSGNRSPLEADQYLFKIYMDVVVKERERKCCFEN